MALAVVQRILLILILLSETRIVLFQVLTWYYFSRYDRRYPSRRYTPRVSIIKPVRGIDQVAWDNFRSFCEQHYPNTYEIIFCVEERTDPCVPLIQRLIAAYPDRHVQLVFSDPHDTRSFGKVKNMIAGFAASRYEVVVFSDSDAHAAPTFLQDTVACVEDPKVGLGYSIPACEGAEDWVAALWNISVNELVTLIVPAYVLGLWDGAVGTAMVVRREVIAESGGLEQFGLQVTDDLPLARAIHKRGYDICLLKQPARILHQHETLRGWWAHWHRWAVVSRHYNLMPFLAAARMQLVIVAALGLPLWWSLVYVTIAWFHGERLLLGVALCMAVLVVRVMSTAVINLKFVHDAKLWRFLWVVPIMDLLMLPLLLYTSLTDKVVWRGRKLRVHRDGTVTYLHPSL